MIHILKPFDTEKNLGRAYNKAMSTIPDGDWACLMDLDTMFLTPDAGIILNEYVNEYPKTGMFTCFANRIHPLSHHQLIGGKISENTNVEYHIELAYEQKLKTPKARVLNTLVSGFLMMISKETWNEIKFDESKKCLGVDNDYCAKLIQAKKSILRMDGLYVFHIYRLKNGINDKSHLL